MVTGAVRLLRLHRRAAASTWAALYTALLLVTGIHQLVVPHAVCEHGAVVHDTHGDEHPPIAVATAVTALDAELHDDDHAHCDIEARSEELTLAASSPQPMAPVIAGLPVAALQAERDALRSQRALRFAPKQSPPTLS